MELYEFEDEIARKWKNYRRSEAVLRERTRPAFDTLSNHLNKIAASTAEARGAPVAVDVHDVEDIPNMRRTVRFFLGDASDRRPFETEIVFGLDFVRHIGRPYDPRALDSLLRLLTAQAFDHFRPPHKVEA